MKRAMLALLLGSLASSLATAAPNVRWPRDAVEWDDFKVAEAVKKGQEEEKGVAFVFVPTEWPDDTDGSVGRSISATNDAIKALKSFCIIVKGQAHSVMQAAQSADGKSEVPKALIEGFKKAGNTYPMVVILDSKMETVLGATAGQNIFEEGSKVFRDAKKKFRELEKEAEEDEED